MASSGRKLIIFADAHAGQRSLAPVQILLEDTYMTAAVGC